MSHPFKLDPFQEEAIDYCRNNYSVIVSAPTGSGKTVIAEDVIEECIRRGTGAIYTAPIKALSNQKYRDFAAKYPDKVGILTGDVSINRDAPILIMTTEIFRNAILVDSKLLESRDWVIFDEIHYLDDIERGTVWEEAIILLPRHMKMLALSATIPNIHDFADWLSKVHAFQVKCVIEKTRPVPLHFFYQCNNQFFSALKELRKSGFMQEQLKYVRYNQNNFNPIKYNKLHTLLEHLREKAAMPCIYFCFSRRRCEDLARETTGFDFLTHEEKEKIVALFDGLVGKLNLNESPHVSWLYPLIKRGIAYHHAGLLPSLKEIIERLFTTGLIKLIFTTETFSLGINMPAKTVAFDDVVKFYGASKGTRYLRTRDFFQMAGRAGRRGIDTQGFIYTRVNPHNVDALALESIIYGHNEPIKSQFNSCYATILNLYSAMGEKIYDIYPNSFHFFQSQGQGQSQKEALGLLKRKIGLLAEMEYLKDGRLTTKAHLASKVYSFELQIGEIFASGFMDTLSEDDIFAAIIGLVYEPRKGEQKYALDKNIKGLKKSLNRFVKEIHRKERIWHIVPYSKKFYLHLSDSARAWARGETFEDILRYCDADEGEMVRYLRMGIQVMREMLLSKLLNERLSQKLRNILDRVDRDEVDAERQLRQEI